MESAVLENQEVVLVIPAQPEFLRVARMTAAGLGSRLGFTIDEVDDLRLALDELCFALIGKGFSGQLRLEYLLQEQELTIRGEILNSKEHQPVELNELSRQILSALVDRHEVCEGDNKSTFTLTKRQVIAQ